MALRLFDFECHTCGTVFESLVHFMGDKQTHPAVCPACQSEQTRRAVSSTTFRLAGSGWERDGYSKGGPRG
jgi:putative FmdB family regulatory protein